MLLHLKVESGNQKLKNIFIFLVCVFGFWFLIFDFCCYAQDKIVAIVNNGVITQKDLDEFVNFMRMQLAQEFSGQELESKIQSMKLDLLDKLIEDQLILQEAKKDNIKIDEDRIKAKIGELKKRYGSEAGLEEALSRQGFTQADIELKMKEQLLMYQIIDTQIRSRILVNPTEVTDFYQKNSQGFNAPELRQVTSVAVDNEPLAKDIVNNLKNGENLDDIANKYSLVLDKLNVQRNGELRRDLQDLVFKLNVGEVSLPLEINNRFYLFRLDKIVPGRERNLSEAQEQVYTFLFNQKMQEELNRWLNELKAKSYIKILQD